MRSIVEFDENNNLKIDGLYAVAVQLVAEYEGKTANLAMYTNAEEEQNLFFGDEVLVARFKEYSLFLSRSSSKIEIVEIDVVPIHPAFDINTKPHIEVKIIDNQVQLLAEEPTVSGNQLNWGIISRNAVQDLILKINSEAIRRNQTGSVSPVYSRASSLSTGNQIIVSSPSSRAGTYANTAQPLKDITNNVLIPSAGTKIMATGEGSYYYLEQLTDTLSKISPTASSTGCNASCTGLCSTGCYGGCSGCTGCTGCGGSCSRNCSGSCSGSCDGSYGCGGDCTYEPGIGECC